ncbi:hypothetical protein D9756_007932 [Leucocoprinus leucothites]|uniref:Major facilitator superfamily (MFS) profile domain-containing protein n=1 Tax=Leucocoprinus leucothites TaxID=201217 RepID=A0A8H5D755_9AGAR|nr:hypothetical protein D9756_007932 [Leucoagaricus leucothites]
MTLSIASNDKSPEDSKVELNSDLESSQDDRKKQERKLVRILDARMTMLMFIFIFNYIDRTNIATARLGGLEDELHLDASKQEFSTLLSIFYAGYIFMMIPSYVEKTLSSELSYNDAILQKHAFTSARETINISPSVLSAMVNHITLYCFTGAVLCRFFLGFVEAAFLPGALFTLASWYTREELGLRTSLMWCGLLVSIPFGQLLASGILDTMGGIGGYSAWRWVFFIEGIISFAISIPAFFILPDFPNSESSKRWLDPELLQIALKRKEEEMVDLAKIPDVTQKEGLFLAVRDWRVWWFALAVGAYQLTQGYYQYFPTIAATLGYNNTISLLLAAPPGFVSAIFTFFVSRHSDKVQKRFPHIVLSLGISVIGLIMAMCSMKIAVRYTAMFLMQAIPAGFVVIMAWVSNTITTPPAKKAVALGLIVACSQLGSFAGAYVFPRHWGPQYTISFGITIASAVFTVLLCFILRMHLASQNKKAEEAVKQNPELRPYMYQL